MKSRSCKNQIKMFTSRIEGYAEHEMICSHKWVHVWLIQLESDKLTPQLDFWETDSLHPPPP